MCPQFCPKTEVPYSPKQGFLPIPLPTPAIRTNQKKRALLQSSCGHACEGCSARALSRACVCDFVHGQGGVEESSKQQAPPVRTSDGRSSRGRPASYFNVDRAVLMWRLEADRWPSSGMSEAYGGDHCLMYRCAAPCFATSSLSRKPSERPKEKEAGKLLLPHIFVSAREKPTLLSKFRKGDSKTIVGC